MPEHIVRVYIVLGIYMYTFDAIAANCMLWGPSRACVQAGPFLYHVINMNIRTWDCGWHLLLYNTLSFGIKLWLSWPVKIFWRYTDLISSLGWLMDEWKKGSENRWYILNPNQIANDFNHIGLNLDTTFDG